MNPNETKKDLNPEIKKELEKSKLEVLTNENDFLVKNLKKAGWLLELKNIFKQKVCKNSFLGRNNDFLNDQTNNFQRIYHERKPGYVNLKIDGWFTRKQIMYNYEMLINEFDEWKVNEDGIRWKYK